MRFLFISEPLRELLTAGDTTLALMQETQARGIGVHHCESRDLLVVEGVVSARCRATSLAPRPGLTVEPAAYEVVRLDAFDAVHLRTPTPYSEQDQHALRMLCMVEAAGAPTVILNRPSTLLCSSSKLYASQFPEVSPPTLVTSDAAEVMLFLEEQGGSIIVKPVDGSSGQGIFNLRTGDLNLPAILETSLGGGRKVVVVQRYIPAARIQDKRIILIDGEPVGAVARIPLANDNRGNCSKGATPERSRLTARDLEICKAVGPRLRADGIFLAGLYVLGDYMSEANISCAGGLVDMSRFDGSGLERRVIEETVARVGARKGQALRRGA